MTIVGVEMIGTIQGLGALILEARTYFRSDVTPGRHGGDRALRLRCCPRCSSAWSATLLPWNRGLESVRR